MTIDRIQYFTPFIYTLSQTVVFGVVLLKLEKKSDSGHLVM